jgi:hypothetical protein
MTYITPRGLGALTADQQDEALDLLHDGATQVQVAARFSVTKNVISGIWSRAGNNVPRPFEPDATTIFDRLDALHDRMDSVLAVTLGIGRIPDSDKPKKPKGAGGVLKLF